MPLSPRSHSSFLYYLATLAIACALSVAAFGLGNAEPMRVKQEPIPDDVWMAMQGVSWHADLSDQCPGQVECKCPPREDLVLLTVPYYDFRQQARTGRMIVARSVAADVSRAMQDIFSQKFPIARIELVDAYGGSDDASMAANNTSAFNCRLAAGSTRLSAHALGKAIDINPIQNPYVKGSTTLPPGGRDYDEPDERRANHMGMIAEGDVVVTAFKKVGWKWGGNWKTLKDYQHFSADGR